MRDFKLKDYLISFFIIIVTLLYFSDEYVFSENIKNVDFLNSAISNIGFSHFSDLIYFLKMKILILFFSITWYLTCNHWWKPAILVIITVELFKFISILNPNTGRIDEIEYLSSLPITIPVILLLVLLSSKLNKYRLSNEVCHILDQEIDEVFFSLNKDQLNNFEELKNKIELVKSESKNLSQSEYIDKLISIRNEFYKI